jgi:molybdopterin molybdotransferase
VEGSRLSGLLSLEDAQAKLLALAPQSCSSGLPLGPVPLPPNRWLAEDHKAARTQPAADLSAMDGYAICGSGPWEKVGESKAGTPFKGSLEPGHCTRISTGAHMPDGAEAVLIQENAEVDGTRITGLELPHEGKHVRRAGFDFAKGETVLRKGTKVTPATLALAISAGLDALNVVEPPAVAVLDSGDELVPAGIPCAPHQIPASNGAMLSAMLAPYVGFTEMLGPVPDDPDKLAEAFVEGENNHIHITSGGASVGDHDLVRPTLEKLGAKIDFWKVAIKPGKPLMVATREVEWGRQVILGLPGNPVSSFVTAYLFALPLVRKCMGASNPLPATVPMIAGEDLPETGPRQEFLRGIQSAGTVSLASSQDSSALKALAMANCLINRPAHSPAVRKGEPLEVYLL